MKEKIITLAMAALFDGYFFLEKLYYFMEGKKNEL